jgi:O-antigen/teichoic acid export membrane protein
MANIKKNFMYHTIWQIMSMILPLVTSPILARALGAEGVGIYSYVSSIVGYFVLVANLGMNKYGTREIARVRDNKEKVSKTFWEIWNLHKLIAVIVGVVYIAFALFIAEYRTYFMVMLVLYIGSVININWLFFGQEDFKKITIRDMMVKLLTFVMIVLFVRSKDSLIVYFVINALGTLVGNLIYWFMYKQYVVKIKVSWKSALSHGKAMFLLFIPVLLENLYAGMDKIMLGIMCAKSEVGYYENADKALISRALIFSLASVLLPRMSNILAKKDYDTFNKLMKQSTGFILMIAPALVFGTAGVAREFSVVFWGSDFIRSANLIIIMSMATPAVVLSREIREQYLIPAGRDKEYILSAAAGTVSNLLINAILIPHYEATGAAIATLISEYVVLIVQMIVVRHEIPMLKYIHGNEIYFVFGFIMFAVVRKTGSVLGIHLYSLLTEILVGVIIYTVLCIGYWIITKQKYYFNLIKTLKR